MRIYEEIPENTEKNMILRLKQIDETVELQAVDERGRRLCSLIKFTKHGAFSFVSAKYALETNGVHTNDFDFNENGALVLSECRS